MPTLRKDALTIIERRGNTATDSRFDLIGLTAAMVAHLMAAMESLTPEMYEPHPEGKASTGLYVYLRNFCRKHGIVVPTYNAALRQTTAPALVATRPAPKFKKGDKVAVKGASKVRTVICVCPSGIMLSGDRDCTKGLRPSDIRPAPIR